MDIVLGIKVKDAVIFATSKAVTRGISILKDNDDKTRELNTRTLMSFTGESGDTTQFADYIQANMKLYSIRENFELSVDSVANFTRQELAKSLRSRKPYQVNILIGGLSKDVQFDSNSSNTHDISSHHSGNHDEYTPSLYQIDYLGTMIELPYAAHGYSGFYTFSLLDHHYRKNMTQQEGLELLKLCVDELDKRMPVDFKGVIVKIVDKDGIRIVDF